MQKLLILVLAWCGINTVGEVLIKFGARTLSEPDSMGDIWRILWEVVQNPLILVGVLFCAADLLLWIYILKSGDLSVVVPLTAINYIFALVAGYFCFNEVISLNRLLGIALICGGTFFLSR